jgi:hypothetical protein
LAAWASGLGAATMLCTGKDLVKISSDRLAELPLWAVDIELEFLTGQEAFEGRLQALLAGIDRPSEQRDCTRIAGS